MTECARCGDCCTDFPLNTPERADIWGRKMLALIGRGGDGWHFKARERKMWAWMANLIVVDGPVRKEPTAEAAAGGKKPYWQWRYRCPVFNEQTRLCGDHTNRPELCVRFPWYGQEPEAGDYKHLSPRCSFVADDPSVTMLPIVEVRHGRADRGPEALRHSAA